MNKLNNLKSKLIDSLPAYLRNEDESEAEKQQQDVVAATTFHG